MTIDGRQLASDGATTSEVGAWLKHFGAHTGINMDGGGSTTMAWWNPDRSGTNKSELLNFPVGTACCFPLERTVGSNIGVYYVPEPNVIWLVVLGVMCVGVRYRKGHSPQ